MFEFKWRDMFSTISRTHLIHHIIFGGTDNEIKELVRDIRKHEQAVHRVAQMTAELNTKWKHLIPKSKSISDVLVED